MHAKPVADPPGPARRCRPRLRQQSRKRLLSQLDLEVLRKGNALTPVLQPLLPVADREYKALIEDIGGRDALSEIEVQLCRDFADAGIVKTAELMFYTQTANLESAGRVLAAINTRTNLGTRLGLERRARPVPDLASYVAAQGPPHASHSVGQAPTPPPNGVRPPGENLASRGAENTS